MKRPLRNRTHRRLRRSAFTLLEVMLVLVILAAIAGIAVVNLGGFQNRANERLAKTQISGLKTALEAYRLEVGSYPSQLNDLYERPSDLADPDKWLQIRKDPIESDPWGNEYNYTIENDNPSISSNGIDGKQGTEDDIGNKS